MSTCAACGWSRLEPPSACVRHDCGLARNIRGARQLWHGRQDAALRRAIELAARRLAFELDRELADWRLWLIDEDSYVAR